MTEQPRVHWFTRLVPESWRWAHRSFAVLGGYFWLPCTACRRPLGGHEWRDIDGLPSSIRLPGGRRRGICPSCTRQGRGVPGDPAVPSPKLS